MADFTGFYLDGIHSSTYGILRVSDGDRYSEGLIPEFDDFDIELTGGNGDLYGGRRFKKTSFTINIAFDHMTEKQFRGLRKWLGGNELKEFRFDERPYKAYWVKVSSRPELEYVCFMENHEDGLMGEKERIYKGEGEIEFIAYNPFGYCVDNSTIMTYQGLQKADGKNWQELESYTPFAILDDNVVEWGETSGLKNSLKEYNKFTLYQEVEDTGVKSYSTKLYNPGDFETDFQLWLKVNETITEEKLVTLYIGNNEVENENGKYFRFSLKGLTAHSNILLNTKNHTLSIYSVDENNNIITKPELRYDLVKSTDWLTVPLGASVIKITCEADIFATLPQIKYSYKYY